ncbi:hypothetical protein IW140_003786 [Coemansia sp. RSA 1813]|nr:hypothetical protein EV178_003500 [Coemansia sp. RSA 1646]KAJ1766665.1 hypothetical protein LPJ74_005764 [Coemansia sp. RSA 1843]KAJ2088679.1 hypothetical protein IW138_004061 [Coemansia sp. RSA 986]KAJ2213116.1 hypothetical protein EV179_004086 [Coemansia sp. RSA 487]KAJ2568580.1 hypothetical protein IW140_003786 [Coemansia sp. RSA 1813]
MVLDNAPPQPTSQFDTLSYSQSTKSQILAVIDTNFFIDHLSLVGELADVAATHSILIVVPWVVIQELDKLKMSTKTSASQGWLDSSENVGAVARSSSRFLESELERNDSPFLFQKRSEYLQREQINDDKILDCCLYFSEKYRIPVVVLTKDRNLGIKVRVNGCAVCSEAPSHVDDFVSSIKAAAAGGGGRVQASANQNTDGSISNATTAATVKHPPQTERIAPGSSLAGRRIAMPKFIKKSSKPTQVPLPQQQSQMAPAIQPYSQSGDCNDDRSASLERSAKRLAREPSHSVRKAPETSKHTSSQMMRSRTKSDRSRRRSSNMKGAGVPTPYTQGEKVFNWDNFQFTFSIPSNVPEVDNRVNSLATDNSNRISQSMATNIHNAASPEADNMDVDSTDEARYSAHSNQTPCLPQLTATSSVTTIVPAVVDKGPASMILQAKVARPSLKRPKSPERADQPVVIYLDESPLETKQTQKSIAQKTATSISEDIVQYMCDMKYCALTSLLMERLKKRDIASLHLGSLETRFDLPPWHTCTAIFTVILYYWSVLRQVLPRGIETSIRRSLPWIMYVEGAQSCPQLKQPLPTQLRITPFTHMPHSNQKAKDAELVAETKLLIQLSKRLLAQCALVESDLQEQQRQKLVSSWVTWQSAKA